jgi:hypothetical protein
VKEKAGTLLSKFIKEIAEETTESVQDPQTGEERAVTKAEVLARAIWQGALGWTETVEVVDKKGAVTGTKEKVHGPDKTYVNIILDRMEGKAPQGTEKDKNQKASLADRVSEQAIRRLNVLAGG